MTKITIYNHLKLLPSCYEEILTTGTPLVGIRFTHGISGQSTEFVGRGRLMLRLGKFVIMPTFDN